MPKSLPPSEPPQNEPAARPRLGLSSIRVKLFLAPFLVCCMLVGLGAYTILGIQESARMARATLDGFEQPADLAGAVRSGFSAMVRMADMAALHDDPHGRQIHLQAVEELGAQLDATLRAIATDHTSARTQALVADIRGRMAGWWQTYNDGIANAFDTDERLYVEILTAAIQDKLEALIGAAEADSRSLRAAAADRAARASLAIAGAVAVLLLLTLVVARLLGRDILRPIDAAADVARRIADGDLDARIPHCGPDETGALLTALAAMQANLRSQVDREVALRKSAQSRLMEAIENSSEAIILVNANDEIVLSNDQTAAFFPTLQHLFQPPLRFSDALRRTEAVGALLPVQRGRDSLIDRFLNHVDIRRVVGDAQLANGRWLRMSFSRTPQGETVAIWSDITELKEREETLRAARDEAEQASRAKSSFLASISHELRTPLNAIIGFSEIIQQELLGPVGTPEYRQYADDILGSGRHLLQIINDILDLSKSETGALSIDLAPVEIGHVVDACRRMMHDQCERAELTVDVALAPDLPWVDADAGRLKQILLNLISNAVKFTDAGGRIEIAAMERAGGIAITVSDTGIGMAPEEIAVALEPFGQVDGDLNRRYEGTGLGLPLSKTLVELHGGRLAIDSTPGEGTRVTITLPAPLAATETAEASA